MKILNIYSNRSKCDGYKVGVVRVGRTALHLLRWPAVPSRVSAYDQHTATFCVLSVILPLSLVLPVEQEECLPHCKQRV